MRKILMVFASWRMAVVLLTGFSAGIPLGLTGGTLQAWMASVGVDLTVIGIFSLVGLPYALKFLWSPLMDRYTFPFLGRRRSWILIAQVLLVFGIAAMAVTDPVATPLMMAVLAFCVAFFSASQDIAVDAYRTEILKVEELGAGAGLYIMGYRIAMVISGAVALILSDHLPWTAVYFIMAATMFIGIVAVLFAPEPQVAVKPPRTLREAVFLPFIEYFRRKGAFEMLGFILLYKIDVAMALAMTTPFMLELGFTKTDIGAVTKAFGLVATIFGTLAGGAIMTRWGIKRSLWVFGFTQAFSGLSFIFLARLGHNYPMMVTAITVENVCSGLGTAAFSAFIMSICDKRYTATQYALLTSFMALTRVLVGTPTGWIAKNTGWEMYFVISTLIAIPGLLLLTRFDRWQSIATPEEQKN